MSKEAAIQNVSNVLQAPKSALTVTGMTTAAGASDYFQILPLNEIALIVGIVSTVIMGVIQIAKHIIFLKTEKDNGKLRRLEREKAHLEIEALKDAAEERHSDDL